MRGGADDFDAADGAAVVAGGGSSDADGALVGIEDPGVIDFGEVVILGGEPEDGDGADARFGEAAGEADGGEGLVEGVGGAGEEADLLAGDDGDGVGEFELGDGRGFSVGAAEGGGERLAALVGDAGGGSGAADGFGVVGVVAVEAGGALEVIEIVRKEGAGPRQFRMGDSKAVHAALTRLAGTRFRLGGGGVESRWIV